MQLRTMTMTTYDAMQKALEQYDADPLPRDPRKLFQRTDVDLVPIDSLSVPKGYDPGKLVNIRLGELLGLAMVGAYSQAALKKGFKVAIGVETSMKSRIENSLTDGAVVPMDSSAGMSVQQVSAQAYYGSGNIMDELIEQTKEKERRRSDYPKACALLVNVYAEEALIDFARIRKECDMTLYDHYFFAFYLLPDLEQCRIVRLTAPSGVPDAITFALDRDPREYVGN